MIRETGVFLLLLPIYLLLNHFQSYCLKNTKGGKLETVLKLCTLSLLLSPFKWTQPHPNMKLFHH